MKCPFCKGKQFEGTDVFRKHLKNLGHKQRFDSVDYRRYVCLSCGRIFKTSETFDEEIIPRKQEIENRCEKA